MPVDRVSSCVRGSAKREKLEQSWLRIAGVRRLLLFGRNETDKTRRAAGSRCPRSFDTLRVAVDVLYSQRARWRIDCSSLFSLHCCRCTLFAKTVSREFLEIL